jgi:hypothetical protein
LDSDDDVDPAYYKASGADRNPDRKIVTVLYSHETVTGLKYGGETYSRTNTLQLPTPDLIAGKYELNNPAHPWHLVTITKKKDTTDTLEWKSAADVSWSIKTMTNQYELALDPAWYAMLEVNKYPDRKTVNVLCKDAAITGLKFGGGTYNRKA